MLRWLSEELDMRIYVLCHTARSLLGKPDQEDMGEAESRQYLANADGARPSSGVLTC